MLVTFALAQQIPTYALGWYLFYSLDSPPTEMN